MVVVIVLVAVGTIHWASRPSSTSRSSIGSSNSGVLGSNNAVTPFASSYFNTQLPADMLLKTSNENPHGAIRASYLFTNTKASPSDQVAISVGTMGLNRLAETPGVKQRLNDLSTYQPANVRNAPEGAMSFKRTDASETAVFWQQGKLYVVVVVSGSSTHQTELDQALQTILTNWSWR
jgi:hypothetical protein